MMKGIKFRGCILIVLASLFFSLTACAGLDRKTIVSLESDVKTRYSKFLKLDGLRIHYYELSSVTKLDSPAIIMVHGWMGSAYDFIKILGLFPPGYRVIAVDLPGCGLSDAWKDSSSYTVNTFVDFLKNFSEALGVERFVLVGHSMGGILTVNFSLTYLEKVNGLILISPDGLKGEEGGWLFFGRLGPITDLLGMMNNRFFLKLGIEWNVFYDDSKITRGLLDSVSLTALTESGRRVQLAITRNIIGRAHVDDVLSFIDKPTMILWGKEDRVLSVKWAKKFSNRIKNSRLVVLERCGHMPMFERPYATARYINTFLREIKQQER